MTSKVNKAPAIGAPMDTRALANAVVREMRDHATRINQALTLDGMDQMTAPLQLANYAKANLPAAASWEGAVVYVNNEGGGKTLAFSDGAAWRRVQDRVIVS